MIDTANYPKMWVAVQVVTNPKNASYEADVQEAKSEVFRMCNTEDAIADICPTGWFRVVTRTDRLPYLFVELYSLDGADGDIPAAVKFFMQINLEADWPADLDPETGHIRGFSTSFN